MSVNAVEAGFPFGGAGGYGFPFGAAQGIGAGIFAGWGWTGWAVAFLVLFFIGFVFWRVWASIGPLTGGYFW